MCVVSVWLLSAVLRAQPAESQGGEREPEVTERDVEVAGDHEQVRDDDPEPGGDDVAEHARLEGDADAGRDLDHADREHQLVTVAADHAVGDAGQVAVPVDQQMEELVETGENRRRDEARLENPVGLVGGAGVGDGHTDIGVVNLRLFGESPGGGHQEASVPEESWLGSRPVWPLPGFAALGPRRTLSKTNASDV